MYTDIFQVRDRTHRIIVGGTWQSEFSSGSAAVVVTADISEYVVHTPF